MHTKTVAMHAIAKMEAAEKRSILFRRLRRCGPLNAVSAAKDAAARMGAMVGAISMTMTAMRTTDSANASIKRTSQVRGTVTASTRSSVMGGGAVGRASAIGGGGSGGGGGGGGGEL